MTRVALYARTSTDDQTTEQQVDALLGYARTQGWQVPSELRFIDQGFSGKNADRPEFQRLKALIEAKLVDVVLAIKIDRLGRSVPDLLNFYEQADMAGVRVICTTQGFDTSTPLGRYLRTNLAAVAELERELIRERVQAGMDRIKRTGKTKSGRPPGRQRVLTPDKLAEARRLKDSGMTWKQVAVRLGLKASSLSVLTPKQLPSLPTLDSMGSGSTTSHE